jgi:hypothetical protein
MYVHNPVSGNLKYIFFFSTRVFLSYSCAQSIFGMVLSDFVMAYLEQNVWPAILMTFRDIAQLQTENFWTHIDGSFSWYGAGLWA